MAFAFSARSLKALEGVHEDLRRVTVKTLELSDLDFVVTEGRRTKERQAELVKSGASRTMDSRHITGHAVDLAPWIGEIRWDWPLFFRLADAMRRAAVNQKVPLRWGGCWYRIDDNVTPLETLVARYVDECHTNRRKPFMDGPHFELPKDIYR